MTAISDTRAEPWPPRPSILVVDRDPELRRFIVETFLAEGYESEAVETGGAAVDLLNTREFDVVLVDLQFVDIDGMPVLRRVKDLCPRTEVVVTTAHGTVKGAVSAIRAGAYDYLTKPFHPEELIVVARRALERKGLAERLKVLEASVSSVDAVHWGNRIIATAPTMTAIIKAARQVARIDSTVLLTGESGTGKELVAKALHASSPRRKNPFVVVSCGAIPESLQESELFGHTHSAFTGAHQNRRGLFEEAHGGTAFLDEVGELTLPAQVKMLRFLQNGEVPRLGDNTKRQLDVRIIAATNRDLERSVEEKTFREDLYYRLNVIPIHLPPLRDRREDIPPLAHYFIKRMAERMHLGAPPAISPRSMSLLLAQRWKGNVRELENVIERAVALDRDGILGLDDFPFVEGQRVEDRLIERAKRQSLTLSELEREYILEVLADCEGSRKKTAERLGITTTTLWRKLKQYQTGR